MEYGIMILFKLSMIASVMALIVLGIRLCLRNTSKIYTYIMWIFVFIRAILPISYSSAYSLWGLLRHFLSSANPSETPAYLKTAAHASGISMRAAQTAPSVLPVQEAQAKSLSFAAAFSNPLVIVSAVWLAGTIVMLCASLISMRKLKTTIRFSTLSDMDGLSKNCRIYESDRIQTAFILGFAQPAIYLPSGLTAKQKRLIIEHESVHVRRHDHQIKMAAWVILSLHWFNPLMWASYCFLNKDMELSCDEQVLRNLGGQIREDYSSLLLDLAVPNRIPSGIPLAFSEGNAKQRIKNVLCYRPIKFSTMATAMFLVIFTLYGCMGNPKQEEAVLPENTETAINETASSPVNDEELAFVKEFIDNMLDNKPEKLYNMLSPALQESADYPAHSGFEFGTYAKGKHYRINPFEPEDPPVIEKTDTGFYYRMRRPKDSPLAEYEKFHSVDVWEGTLSLESDGKGGLQVAEWEENTYNEIGSYEEYLYFTNMETFGKSSIFYVDTQYAMVHPEALAGKDLEDIFTEYFHLTDGKITHNGEIDDITRTEISYSWDDGSITFDMAHNKATGNWTIIDK